MEPLSFHSSRRKEEKKSGASWNLPLSVLDRKEDSSGHFGIYKGLGLGRTLIHTYKASDSIKMKSSAR